MAGSHPLTRNPEHQSTKLIFPLPQPFKQLALLGALSKVTQPVGSQTISHHNLISLSLCPAAASLLTPCEGLKFICCTLKRRESALLAKHALVTEEDEKGARGLLGYQYTSHLTPCRGRGRCFKFILASPDAPLPLAQLQQMDDPDCGGGVVGLESWGKLCPYKLCAWGRETLAIQSFPPHFTRGGKQAKKKNMIYSGS